MSNWPVVHNLPKGMELLSFAIQDPLTETHEEEQLAEQSRADVREGSGYW